MTNIKKIVIAPDSFKESMAAIEVADAIERGFAKVFPNTTVYDKIPMADGGEGTTEALVNALNASYRKVSVKNPINKTITASYGYAYETNTAIIDMASASGLDLIAEEDKNPLITTSYGTGQLINDAIEQGAQHIILGIGGSATNDGGVGMLSALGCKFLDSDNQTLKAGGAALAKLSHIDMSNLNPKLKDTTIEVACDVTNPLLGKYGASEIYGRQKGATEDMIKQLDAALTRYHDVIEQQLNVSVKDIEGAGAAGGLGTGLLAFLNANLAKGIDIVLKETQFTQRVKDADLVITGEGKMDHQTIYGKTPIGVSHAAQRFNVPVIAIAGSLGEGYQAVYEHGISSVFSILQQPCSLSDALENGRQYMEQTAENIARLLLIDKNHNN
ncbi:glycerate kinase [Staphylococcus sp. 18_1_E_LY]|uniref:Glycerate kinase n=1 Tax=Staphylococcus lloydii TaxID=2781774 RepID=A0A7T1B0U6_9STAP|nr:glycerate kinase [Staphylococcus lloydii]MBF7020318.1 glycerate kinase [Staphylococcus lloydii]MBF7028001.1 glycerate kinase [Staphylococcus lloydii]QPM75667.1 glycerate kinase [Staphylococcus lloydii]